MVREIDRGVKKVAGDVQGALDEISSWGRPKRPRQPVDQQRWLIGKKKIVDQKFEQQY